MGSVPRSAVGARRSAVIAAVKRSSRAQIMNRDDEDGCQIGATQAAMESKGMPCCRLCRRRRAAYSPVVPALTAAGKVMCLPRSELERVQSSVEYHRLRTRSNHFVEGTSPCLLREGRDDGGCTLPADAGTAWQQGMRLTHAA